jgi:hypothetical protein
VRVQENGGGNMDETTTLKDLSKVSGLTVKAIISIVTSDEWIDTKAAAKILKYSHYTVIRWRRDPGHPLRPYINTVTGQVRYKRDEVYDFKEKLDASFQRMSK